MEFVGKKLSPAFEQEVDAFIQMRQDEYRYASAELYQQLVETLRAKDIISMGTVTTPM